MTATSPKKKRPAKTRTAKKRPATVRTIQLPIAIAEKIDRKSATRAGGFQKRVREYQDRRVGDNGLRIDAEFMVDVESIAHIKPGGGWQDLALAIVHAHVQQKYGSLLQPTVDGLVLPGSSEVKSGCLWCPLLPWSHDFKSGGLDKRFHRPHEKILAKERDGHTVQTRCVTEEWDEVDILFVGEAPGKVEDMEKWGTPFVGKSGQMLRRALEHAVPDARIGVTNIVACRPPRNRDPNKTEVQSCSPRLVREIKARKPKVLVALGNTSLEFLAGQRGITTFAGKVLDCVLPEFDGMKVVACLHPAYVMRFDYELDKFVDALEIAAAVLQGEWEPKQGVGEYFVVDKAKDAIELLEALSKSDNPVSFDTETGGLSPFQKKFPKLLCFSFSDEEGVGYTIPWDHVDSSFSRKGSRDRTLVAEALRRFFESTVAKVAQNPGFDLKHIYKSLGVWVRNVWDTMMGHFCLDERRGTHGLKSMAYAYTGMGGYEQPLEGYLDAHPEANPNKGGSYANIPGEILFRYAAMDADVTIRVRNGLREETEFQESEPFQALADTFYPAFTQTLAEVEYAGAQVEPPVVSWLDRRYTVKMKKLTTKIQKLRKVRQFVRDRIRTAKKTGDPDKVKKAEAPFNPGSNQQLQNILFGYYGCRPKELTDGGFSKLLHRFQVRKEQRDKQPAGKKGKSIEFAHIVEEAIKNQEWEYFSTKADVLHDFARDGNELCNPILEFRGYETLHGTFVKPLQSMLDDKNRIHGTYLAHGTVTARLASRDPNLQNIPNKGGGLIKRAYVSRFGQDGVLVQADYSQVELRVAACWFDEPQMIQAYVNNEDLHHLTALDISHKDAKTYSRLHTDVQKQWRTRAKRVNFGVLYGGGPPALVLTLRKDGIFITDNEAKKLIDDYFKARPGLKRGLDRTMKQVRKDGYLEAFTGHRRRVPEVFSGDEQIVARALRQSINFPIQCGAAQMTNMALILIHREMKHRKLRSQIILTVHDSIIFDCHIDEMFEVSLLAKEIMESIHERSDEVLPGLDWSWLRVPLVSDLESGFTWGSLVEWKEAKVGAEKKIILPGDPDVDWLWEAMEQKDELVA